jgi:hypothetical protein
MRVAQSLRSAISVGLALVGALGFSGCRSFAHPFSHPQPAGAPAAYASQRPGTSNAPLIKGGHPPHEYLDPVTAASVAVVASPIVFARAHQDVSSNSRQYATVAAASVNKSGRYDYVLLVYLWSTVDPRLAADVHPGETVVLLADDRAIKLTRDGRTLKEAGLAHPVHAPLHTRGPPRLYRTDKATLEFISKARRLRLQLEGDEDPRPFDLWTDGRADLARLISG